MSVESTQQVILDLLADGPATMGQIVTEVRGAPDGSIQDVHRAQDNLLKLRLIVACDINGPDAGKFRLMPPEEKEAIEREIYASMGLPYLPDILAAESS